MTLAPQQTPFVPPVSCTLSVHCPFMSNLLYSAKSSLGRHPLSGQRCQAFYTTEGAQLDPIQEIEACMPNGYRQLNREHVLGLDSFLSGGNGQLSSTEAYPGTACMQGWSSACSHTVGSDESISAHIWCCPEGSWECQASTTDFEGWMTGHRLCRSIMTEATNVWMSFDPPVAGSDSDHMVYTWHRSVTAEPQTQFAARIYHHAIPLDGTGTTSNSNAQDPTSKSHATGPVSNGNSNPPATLTTGEFCGIVIGGTAFVLLLVFTKLYFCLPYLRKRRQSGQAQGRRELSIQTAALHGKAKGDLSSGSIFGVFPRAELDANTADHQLACVRNSHPGQSCHLMQGTSPSNTHLTMLPQTSQNVHDSGHIQPPGLHMVSNAHIHELQG